MISLTISLVNGLRAPHETVPFILFTIPNPYAFFFRRRSLRREEPDSVATDKAFASSLLASSCSSMPRPKRPGSCAGGPDEASPRTPAAVSTVSGHVPSSSSLSPPALGRNSAPVAFQRAKSLDGVLSGTPQMSAALPRGFRRSEGTSRLSAGVTPKPFSTKTSRRSTQPRLCSVSAFTFHIFRYFLSSSCSFIYIYILVFCRGCFKHEPIVLGAFERGRVCAKSVCAFARTCTLFCVKFSVTRLSMIYLQHV